MTARADRIQNALRLMAAQHCEAVVIPPFAAYIDRVIPLSFFSYAIPEPGAVSPWDPSPIEELRAVFESAGRVARFEFIESCWPGLVEMLLGAGFEVEQRLPGMTCESSALTGSERRPEVSLERVGRDSSAEAIAELLRIKWLPFSKMEEPPPVDAAAIENFRRTGAASVVARCAEGRPAGSAGWLSVQDGVSEIVAIGVLPGFRRRGIAAALTVEAGRCAEREGADLLFLTPEHREAGRVYERTGFAVADDCSVVKLAAVAAPT